MILERNEIKMELSKRAKIFKIIIFIFVLLLFVGLTIYLFPIMQKLFSEEGRANFKAEIEANGEKGFFILLGLQMLQILLPILPGEPIEILAGMCYGTIWGTIFIMISTLITTTIIFFLVRKLGRGFVYSICSKEKVEKIENSKLFKNSRKLEYIMFILFLIPGTPKDLLIYIAGLLPIKPIQFILISTFIRFPSVISSTIAGSNIVIGNWQFGILAYVIIFIIVGVAIYILNKYDKTQLTQNIISTVSESKTRKKI